MGEKLTDLATGKLLEKFGAGNHKPGLGSASAFQGMLSAQMLRTVIGLTNGRKNKPAYSPYIPELLRLQMEIESHIYPALEKLFQEDSEQFDKVIKLREQRDIESNLSKKRQLTAEAKDALLPATEIPIKIAELCLELADFAAYIFDHGFRSARGDSSVALNTAISGVASCLSIVELNLISLPVNPRTEKIRQDKANIKLLYGAIIPRGVERLKILEKESAETKAYLQSISIFRGGNLAETVNSNADIEELVKRLQNTLWLHRGKIWKNEKIEDLRQILKPDVVLTKVMEYNYSLSDNLGVSEQGGELIQIAGIIDKNKKVVRISRSFPPETQILLLHMNLAMPFYTTKPYYTGTGH
jgi:formiminotetrahydrofolate cyclodeaminase